MNSILESTYETFHHTLHFVTKVQNEVAAVDTTHLFNVVIKYLNATVGVPTTRVLRVFTKIPSAYTWVAEVNELASGADNRYPLKFSSIVFFCLSDVASGLVWINTLGIDWLSYISSSIANLPFLTHSVKSLPLLSYQCEFFGTVLDAIDASMELINHHRVIYNAIRLTGDIAQIAGILFAHSTGHFLLIATIASGTSNVLYLTRFALDYYKCI